MEEKIRRLLGEKGTHKSQENLKAILLNISLKSLKRSPRDLSGELKETSTWDGLIEGNIFNGTGMSGVHFADTWMDAKGSFYRIYNNSGRFSLTDGFQVDMNNYFL